MPELEPTSEYLQNRLEEQARATAARSMRLRMRLNQLHHPSSETASNDAPSLIGEDQKTEELYEYLEDVQEGEQNSEQGTDISASLGTHFSRSTVDDNDDRDYYVSGSNEFENNHGDNDSLSAHSEDLNLMHGRINSDATSDKSKKTAQFTMDDFMLVVCKDQTIEWNERMVQVARVMMESEHPKRLTPNLRDMMLIAVRKVDNGMTQHYRVGDWVETLGPNMCWNVERVTKVHKIKSAEKKIQYFYNVGSRSRLSSYDMRVSEEGLRQVYGSRAWIWQQWALLKLENVLRFQDGHENDFESLDIPQYARDLWFQWLHHERNTEFRNTLLQERLKGAEEALFDHMMKPFYILDDIQKDNGWIFENEIFSIYTYLSLHGTGFFMCGVSLILQFFIPVVIVLNTVVRQDYYRGYGKPFEIIKKMFCVEDESVPFDELIRLATAMVMCIQILYVAKVVPDTTIVFKDVSGVGGYGAEKTYARCRSLCVQVLNTNKSRVNQMFGKIIDMYMNTVYVYIVFAVNLYNILNRAEPIEVILNALALSFLIEIDESFCCAVWWDPGRRFLKAGTMEIFLQSVIEIKALKSSKLFAKLYGIDQKIIQDACDGDECLVYDYNIAEKDRTDTSVMNHSEMMNFYLERAVTNSKYSFYALNETMKPNIVFGKIESIIYKWYAEWYNAMSSNEYRYGIFNRFCDYETWNRWEAILFLADIPSFIDIFEINAYDDPIVSKTFERVKNTKKRPFANFNVKSEENITGITQKQISVLNFSALKKRLELSLYQGDYLRFMLWFVNGPLEWSTYVIQLAFPLFNLSLFVLSFWCVDLSKLGEGGFPEIQS